MSSSRPGARNPRVLAAAIRYVRSGPRSIHEIRTYLRQRDVSPRVAAQVIAICEARGLLDDGASARLLAGHWARHGYAWAAIHARLADKGFSERVIAQAAVSCGATAADDAARACAVVTTHLQRERRRLASGLTVSSARGTGRRTARRETAVAAKAARALAARGFDPSLIERILQESGVTPSDAES